LPPSIADDGDVGELVLETGGARLGGRQKAFHEQILGHVIRKTCAVHRVDAEILDAEGAEIRADLKILSLDLGRLHLAAGDLGLDDGRFALGLVDHYLVVRLLAAMEPAAAGQQRCR